MYHIPRNDASDFFIRKHEYPQLFLRLAICVTFVTQSLELLKAKRLAIEPQTSLTLKGKGHHPQGKSRSRTRTLGEKQTANHVQK